jgi:hypothetical protein
LSVGRSVTTIGTILSRGRGWMPALPDGKSVLGILAAVLTLFVVKFTYHRLEAVDALAPLALLAAHLVLAIAFISLRWKEFGPSCSLLLKGMAVVLGIYGLMAGLTFPSGESVATDRLILATDITRYVQLACAALALWRPSFAMIPAIYVMTYKAAALHLFGIDITFTDYLPLIELSLFITYAFIARRGLKVEPELYSGYVFIAAVGAHFANYFWSARAKVAIGDSLTHWVFENNTAWLSVAAQEVGIAPLGHWPWLVSMAVAGMVAVMPLINALTLGGQFFSVVAITRRSWIIVTTLFYDLTHVIIFLVSGIFFWKWILLNLLIVASARKMPKLSGAALIGIAMVLLVRPVFFVAKLGWYDTPALVDSYVVAVTKEGQSYRVPSNYFGTFSVTMAQQRLARPPGHYPTVSFGAARTREDWKAAEDNCRLAMSNEPLGIPDGVASFLQRHHRYVLSKVDAHGRYNYDLYPHHIWSNPLMFRDFARLDKRRIDHYVYVVQSKCMHLDGTVDVLKDDRIRIDVGN